MVNGKEFKNRASYSYFPNRDINNWNLVSFKLNDPDEITGNLNFQNIKKIRFDIEYSNISRENLFFNVYLDQIKLTKVSTLSKILYLFAIIAFVLSLSFRIKQVFKLLLTWLKNNSLKQKMRLFFQYTFSIYLTIFLIRIVNPIFLFEINLHYLLFFAIFFGIFSLSLKNTPLAETKNEPFKIDYLIVILVLFGMFIISFKLMDYGWFSFIVSFFFGIFVILFSLSNIQNQEI